MAHRVDIQKSQEPRFPDCCVNCGAASPGKTMSIKGALSSNKPSNESIFQSWKADVPCCANCQGTVRRHRFVAKVLFGVSVVVGLFLILLSMAIWPGLEDSWLFYVDLFVCMAIPAAIIDSLHVPQIDFTPSGDRLAFEFKNRDFALQFAELNESNVH